MRCVLTPRATGGWLFRDVMDRSRASAGPASQIILFAAAWAPGLARCFPASGCCFCPWSVPWLPRDAWFKSGSRTPISRACPNETFGDERLLGFIGDRAPTGTSASRCHQARQDPSVESLKANTALANACTVADLASRRVKQNSVTLRHIWCRTTPMARASAVVARFWPRRFGPKSFRECSGF